MDDIPTLTWAGFQLLGPGSKLTRRNGVFAAYYLALKCPLCGLALPETSIFNHVASCMLTPDHIGTKDFDHDEWRRSVRKNKDLPPKKLFHKNLQRADANSEHKSICPECGSVLLMRRKPNFHISTLDNCILCGRQYHYVDIEENQSELIYKEGHSLMAEVLKQNETITGTTSSSPITDPGSLRHSKTEDTDGQ